MSHSKSILAFTLIIVLFSASFAGITTSQDDDNLVTPIAALQIDGSNQVMWLLESTTLVIANNSAIVFVDVAQIGPDGDATPFDVQMRSQRWLTMKWVNVSLLVMTLDMCCFISLVILKIL